MRQSRRIRNSATLGRYSKVVVIKKPDRVKKIAIPSAAIHSFMFRYLGPSGKRCPASTNKMLIPRKPSRAMNRSIPANGSVVSATLEDPSLRGGLVQFDEVFIGHRGKLGSSDMSKGPIREHILVG